MFFKKTYYRPFSKLRELSQLALPSPSLWKCFLFNYVALTFFFCSLAIEAKSRDEAQDFILATQRIHLKKFPDAFNPSIIKMDKGFILTFRHCLASHDPWISYIGVVALDETLKPISSPQILTTRNHSSKIPSHSEDARIFSYQDQLYIAFNDNNDVISPTPEDRRDMFIAKIHFSKSEKRFTLSKPLKLCHQQRYDSRKVQKNWTPFVWDNKLLFIYTGNPHEIIHADMQTGMCQTLYTSSFACEWDWGEIRGGTPAELVDGEYLTFFHSMKIASSSASKGMPMFHYYMGAYTFSAEPPFEITKISPSPLIGKNFYTRSDFDKRVVFPGGFAVTDNYIYVAYGKDDREIWIAIIDKDKLKASLTPCRGP